jgi:hypothetical protein
MLRNIGKLQTRVSESAQRLDLALVAVEAEKRQVRRRAKVIPAGLLLGVGVAGGFLIMLMPKHMRGSVLLGLGRFALARLMPLLSGVQE